MANNNIYLYLGEEKHLINNKIERLIKETKVDDYNITSFDAEEVSVSSVIEAARTLPFMSENKVVIIKNPKFLTADKFKLVQDLSPLIKYLENPVSSTVLIINATLLKLDERLEVVKLLKKKAVVSETHELSDIEFTGWLKRQCDLEGITIKDDAVKLFTNIVGKDLINAQNEVDKLVAYIGRNGIITTKIINMVVVREIQNDIYALSNTILEKNKEKTIENYRDLISIDNDVNKLFNLVSKTIKDTLVVNLMLQEGAKQAEVAERMKVSPGKAYYLVKNAKAIDSELAKEYLVKLGDLDYKIKSGQVDAKTGFEFFLLGL